MTAAQLRTLCEVKYKPTWQAVLALKLVRNPRTIRRWVACDSPVPNVVVKWLEKQE